MLKRSKCCYVLVQQQFLIQQFSLEQQNLFQITKQTIFLVIHKPATEEEMQYYCEQLQLEYNPQLYFYTKIIQLDDFSAQLSIILLQQEDVDVVDKPIQDYWIKIAQCHIVYFDNKELQKKINFFNKEQITLQISQAQDLVLDNDFFVHIKDKLNQKKITSDKLFKKEDVEEDSSQKQQTSFFSKIQSIFHKK